MELSYALVCDTYLLGRDRATWEPKGALAPAGSKKNNYSRLIGLYSYNFWIPINIIFGFFQQN